MSEGLAAWLLLQIDRDERWAQAATVGRWRYRPMKVWHDPPRRGDLSPAGEEFVGAGPLDAPVCVAATGPADDAQAMDDARHIALWHPVRALAECEAKRQIIQLHQPVEGHYEYWEGPKRQFCGLCAQVVADDMLTGDLFPCGTLRLLSTPYQDRAGYRPEWAPELSS